MKQGVHELFFFNMYWYFNHCYWYDDWCLGVMHTNVLCMYNRTFKAESLICTQLCFL